MGGWCRTLLSPENRQGQLRASAGPVQGRSCLPSSWALEGVEVPPITEASRPRQPSRMPQGAEEDGVRWEGPGTEVCRPAGSVRP